jgi:hypothetical protein
MSAEAAALHRLLQAQQDGVVAVLDGHGRGVLLHLIEETARHAGHVDAARELLDGRVGLGPR